METVSTLLSQYDQFLTVGDCVSFKPNSTNILVQNMFCNGSHGISVGSLGQYVGAYDIVENIYVFNTSLHNTTVGSEVLILIVY
jgi:galacturan 1,4-alpha-galacturonidase